MYVCMYACMYACMHVCMYVCVGCVPEYSGELFSKFTLCHANLKSKNCSWCALPGTEDFKIHRKKQYLLVRLVFNKALSLSID